MERLPKEQVFEIIDKKLETIKSSLASDQQMDMGTFYDIFTRSNELIHIVDCRSREEYDCCHISRSLTLEDYHSHTEWKRLPIRTFFVSRIGERSAAIVKEELQQGVKAYNVNGGIIEWLHYKGYCDFADNNTKSVNIVNKEFAPLIPEGYTAVCSD